MQLETHNNCMRPMHETQPSVVVVVVVVADVVVVGGGGVADDDVGGVLSKRTLLS